MAVRNFVTTPKASSCKKTTKLALVRFGESNKFFFASSCSISERLFEPQVATPINGDSRGGFRLFYLICIATAFNTR